ncbi:GNAT family N-acetyltransferase [Streptomyces sp. NBC_01716]|uniref:GNAT family N-acetyltransferase n=1 Tax=Streptomyces sp. NBC_01716 TaxID=2975917 RepID=UPI002E3620C0|nr:GNAT family N-acetyltransferase [Streptomyces sp. NBC_01716]
MVLVERRGATDVLGGRSDHDQAHIVGVYLRPEFRGAGLLKELFDAAVAWAWSLEEPRAERVRLFVDERNGRARAAYRKLGFEPTGETLPVRNDPAAREFELAVPRPGVRSG